MSLKTLVNSIPEYAFRALTNCYHGKVYLVGNSRNIEKFCKTKRSAESYINKQSSSSYYDEYLQKLVSYNQGLFLEELKDNEIIDPTTNKQIWYTYLKSMLGVPYMYDTILSTAKRIIIDPELLEWVNITIEEMRRGEGFLNIAEFEPKEEVEAIEENNSEVITEQEEVNTIDSSDIEISFNSEMNGIEIKFTDKPEKEVLENLKSNGFRWSRNQGLWYAKDTADRREFIKQFNSIPTEAAPKQFDYPEIDINDINTYIVDENLSKRENEASWVFRTKERNHTEEIQGYYQELNNQVLEVLSKTDNKEIIYKLKKALQRFKALYFKNYISKLSHKANNPSWAVTGRAGRNRRKDEKANNRHDKLMSEGIELIEWFKSELNKAENKINRDNSDKLYSDINNINNTIEFTSKTEEITEHGITDKVRVYRHGEYAICKTWGSYRVYKNGKEIYRFKTTDTLETAKKYVCMLVNADNSQQAVNE